MFPYLTCKSSCLDLDISVLSWTSRLTACDDVTLKKILSDFYKDLNHFVRDARRPAIIPLVNLESGIGRKLRLCRTLALFHIHNQLSSSLLATHTLLFCNNWFLQNIYTGRQHNKITLNDKWSIKKKTKQWGNGKGGIKHDSTVTQLLPLPWCVWFSQVLTVACEATLAQMQWPVLFLHLCVCCRSLPLLLPQLALPQ